MQWASSPIYGYEKTARGAVATQTSALIAIDNKNA